MDSGKIIIIILSVLLSVVCIGGGIFIVSQNKRMKEQDAKISEQQMQIEQTQAQMMASNEQQQGYETTIVYTLATDVGSGAECVAADLQETEVPLASAANGISDITELEGRYYRLDIKSGTMLTEDMLFDFVITEDMRYLDVVVDETPIGLQVGDYVDLRIAFATGQDYVAMTHKMIRSMNGSVVKLIVSLKDLYTYQSLKTDKATYSSTKMYMIEYIDAGTQVNTDNFYPISNIVLKTMQSDVNIKLNADDVYYTKTERKRLLKILDNAVENGMLYKSEDVTSGISVIDAVYQSAQAAYDAQSAAREEAEEQQREIQAAQEEAQRAAEEAQRAAEEAAAAGQ